MRTKLLTTAFLLSVSLIAVAQVFSDDFTGIDSIRLSGNRPANVLNFYNDGDSILYICGIISYVNEISASTIFSWDTDTIKAYTVNNIMQGGGDCTIKYKDTLYVGGDYRNFQDESRNYLNFWNGTSWQGLRSGPPNTNVNDMCIYDGKLWICGNFSRIGNVTYDKIAAYNGVNWENVGSFGMYADALEVFNGELYAGGFNSWGIRRYLGGGRWERFTERPGDDVFCLKADTINTFLYAGGQFLTISGIYPSIGVAMWDGFNWHPMDYEHGNTVWRKALAVYHGDLYTGHGSTYDEETDTWNFFICRWDGEQWDSLGGGFSSSIAALEVFQNELYIGGYFQEYDGQRSKGMRKMSFPDNGCNYIKPRINTHTDTFYMRSLSGAETSGTAEAQFYNNNPYVDSWEWDFGDGGTAYEKDPLHIYTQPGIYNVVVTVRDGECERSYTRTIRVDDLSSTGEYEDIDFQIFPNPSSSNFTVRMDLHSLSGGCRAESKQAEVSRTVETTAELRISGINGHLKNIIPVTSDETIINTQYWKPGTYICNLFVDGRMIRTEKLILE